MNLECLDSKSLNLKIPYLDAIYTNEVFFFFFIIVVRRFKFLMSPLKIHKVLVKIHDSWLYIEGFEVIKFQIY